MRASKISSLLAVFVIKQVSSNRDLQDGPLTSVFILTLCECYVPVSMTQKHGITTSTSRLRTVMSVHPILRSPAPRLSPRIAPLSRTIFTVVARTPCHVLNMHSIFVLPIVFPSFISVRHWRCCYFLPRIPRAQTQRTMGTGATTLPLSSPLSEMTPQAHVR
ncbi:hypothetical protein BGZ60DRAFT_394142 [Tricladium varicosporioides]|nr:hypothetical protein BGZ60DRAFT_394142 [Hymenoscyphus varicosporioides]